MADIFEFTASQTCDRQNKGRGEPLTGKVNTAYHAEIIIFPGVRYDRQPRSGPKKGSGPTHLWYFSNVRWRAV